MFIRGYAKNPQHARYCEKSQLFSLKIKLLKRIFPDAKFILVLRNPYAICFRIAKKNYEAMSSGKITQYSYEEKLTLAAQHWKNSIQTALQDLKDINEGYIIKIEDYLKKPEKYIEEIVTYCELPYEGDLLPAKHQKLPRGSLDTKKWYPLEKEINAKYHGDDKVKREDFYFFDMVKSFYTNGETMYKEYEKQRL